MADALNPTPADALPPQLVAPLRAVARRQRAIRIAKAALQSLLIIFVVSLIAVLILGSLNHIPTVVRWLLALAAWAIEVIASIRILRPAFAPVSLYQAARQIEAATPAAQERILSAVELAAEHHDAAQSSAELVRHLLQQATAQAGEVKPDAVVAPAAMWRWVAYLAPALLAWLILWPLVPQTVELGLQRVIAPWNGSIPADLGAILVKPGNTVITQGQPLTIMADFKPTQGVSLSGIAAALTTRFAGGATLDRSMTPIGPASFRRTLNQVSASFDYRIASSKGNSAWYHVIVEQRPAVAAYEQRYNYPAYTQLPPQVTTGSSGAIQAITGTQVQLVLHVNQKLSARSRLAFGKAGPAQTAIPLTPMGPGVYQATFNVLSTTTYRALLVNDHGIKNSDDRRWPIVATRDLPPTIHITSPRRVERVRPDDTVPVAFAATDDFGLTAIHASVSVNQSAPFSVAIPMGVSELKQFNGQWSLSVADILTQANVPKPEHIYYRLVATDNCQPAAQSARTTRHELDIDPWLGQSFRQRMDRRASRSMEVILRRTLQQVQNKQNATRRLAQNINAQTGWNQWQLPQVKQRIAAMSQASTTLDKSMQSFLNGDFANIANQAIAVARHPMRRAADALTQASFNPHQPSQLRKDAAATSDNLAQAAQRLNSLINALAQAAKQRDLEATVKQLAAEQKHLANKMLLRQSPKKLSHTQQQLTAKLQKLVNQHKALQTPMAANVQPELGTLGQKVEQAIALQKQANTDLMHQSAMQQQQQTLANLAQQQQHLNQDIRNFQQQRQQVLRESLAQVPTGAERLAAVSNLQHHQYASARQGQQHMSQELATTANQLSQLANRPPTPQQQQARQNAQQSQNAAQELARQAASARQLLHNQPGAPAEVNARRVAKALNNLNQQLMAKSAGSQESRQLKLARKLADQAAAEAQKNNAQEAAQSLSKAAKLLQSAAAQQAAAAQAPTPDQQQAQAAAQQASQLAQRQQALAKQTADAQSEAASQTPATANSKPLQQQALQQIAAARKLAAHIAKQAATGSPDIADNVKQADAQMRQAQQRQQQAADATAKGNNPLAQEKQQAALAHMKIAQLDLQGLQNSPELALVPKYQSFMAHAGEINPQAPDETSGHKAGAPQNNNAPPQQPGNQGNPTGANPGQSNSSGSQTGQAASQGRQKQGQGQPGQTAASGQPGAGQPGAAAGQPSAQPAPTPNQMRAMRMFEAAQRIQAALAAQQQAGQGSATAAQQAAQALAVAGEQISQAAGLTAPSQMAAGTGQSGSAPGLSAQGGSGAGINAPQQINDKPPTAVASLGISPADWRNLGPLQRQNLVNAAGQKIPAGYRDMIRQYYLRLARMHPTNSKD
ncbi:MAG: DUF4175 family protein [Phycisphaerales bacterium]|nr:DUF4175 family protein [Phycisphaerales bacterium]